MHENTDMYVLYIYGNKVLQNRMFIALFNVKNAEFGGTHYPLYFL